MQKNEDVIFKNENFGKWFSGVRRQKSDHPDGCSLARLGQHLQRLEVDDDAETDRSHEAVLNPGWKKEN